MDDLGFFHTLFSETAHLKSLQVHRETRPASPHHVKGAEGPERESQEAMEILWLKWIAIENLANMENEAPHSKSDVGWFSTYPFYNNPYRIHVMVHVPFIYRHLL